MRFAIVGCGVIAPTHARALRQLAGRVDLVACVDVDPSRAVSLAEELGVPARGFDEVLADPAVDAVSVCTPSGLHAEVGVPALLAGKHVVVEKPMEVTVEACDRLLQAQSVSGATLGVICQHRFDAASLAAKAAVDDATLGPLVLVDARVPWYRTQEYYDSGDWRGSWALDGGGALMNQGIHTLDLMRWICGPVTSVHARANTAAHERIEVEDVVVATLTFANGALGTVVASTAVYPGFPARLALHGARGTAVVEGDRLATLASVDRPSPVREDPTVHALQVATGGTRAATAAVAQTGEQAGSTDDEVWGEAHRRQLLDFVDAVDEGRAPVVDGLEGRRTVELVRAIYTSARTGEVITLGQPTEHERRPA